MKINELDIKQRPRERLINEGVINLSDIELLAIMLGEGTKNEGVIELSTKLINKYGLKKIFNMNYDDLIKLDGIKKAKATKIIATFEIARRSLKKEDIKIKLDTSKILYEYIKNDFLLHDNEVLEVIYVDTKCNFIDKDIYTDNLSGHVKIPFRKIVINALRNKCFGVFLAHNHPSGDLTPSQSDIESTFKLKDTLNSINIHLFDHLIIGKDDYYSFNDK